jgi:hypothetical protein
MLLLLIKPTSAMLLLHIKPTYKPYLYVYMSKCLYRRAGDFERAKELCDELNSLSTLRFDPTNPDGQPGEWDVSIYIYVCVCV